MFKKNTSVVVTLALMIALAVTALPSCSPGGVSLGPPGDSKVTGKVEAIHQNVSRYKYEVVFTVLSSENVGTLPNPTKDEVGMPITASTNEDIPGLDRGKKFTANVKWALDPTKAVPIFYIYNVKDVQ